jgi:hypothetical protein
MEAHVTQTAQEPLRQPAAPPPQSVVLVKGMKSTGVELNNQLATVESAPRLSDGRVRIMMLSPTFCNKQVWIPPDKLQIADPDANPARILETLMGAQPMTGPRQWQNSTSGCYDTCFMVRGSEAMMQFQSEAQRALRPSAQMQDTATMIRHLQARTGVPSVTRPSRE